MSVSTVSGVSRNLKSEGGGSQGYISGVHFQKCTKFIIFFTLNISTKIFALYKSTFFSAYMCIKSPIG